MDWEWRLSDLWASIDDLDEQAFRLDTHPREGPYA